MAFEHKVGLKHSGSTTFHYISRPDDGGVASEQQALSAAAEPPKPAAGAADQGAAADAAKGKQNGAAANAADGKEVPAAAAPPALAALNVAADTVPQQLVSLGSLDEESGYRMLVTLTNHGAAVQRVELTSPRFRDLQDRSGYLGQLELEPAEGGVKATVVGGGTPAAIAGIEAGDVISEVTLPRQSPQPVKTVEDFQAALATTNPGQEITLQIARGSSPAKSVAVNLTRRPFEVIRPEIENIRMRNATPPAGFVDRPSFLVTLATLGGKAVDAETAAHLAKWLEEGNWEITQHDQSSVTFERTIPDLKLKLVKHYVLAPAPAGSRSDENYPAYDFQLDVELQNIGQDKQTVAYRLDGPTGLPLEGWWYAHKISQRWFAAAGLRDVVVRFHGSAELQIDATTIADDKAEPMGQGSSLAYVGVDGLYFASVMIPNKESLDDVWFDTIEAIRVGPKPDARTPRTFTNVTCRLTRKPIELKPGESRRDSYQVFVGPKFPELLAQYKAAGDPNYSLRDIIYYGMTPFGDVAQLMQNVSAFLLRHRRQLWHRDHHADGLRPRHDLSDQLQANEEHGPDAGSEAGARSHHRKVQDRHAEAVGGDAGAVSQEQNQSARRLPAAVFAIADLHWALPLDHDRRSFATSAAVWQLDALVLRPDGARHALQLVAVHAGVRQQRRRTVWASDRISTCCRSSRWRCSSWRKSCRCRRRPTSRP